MRAINLLPPSRLHAQRAARRKRTWILVAGAYALVAVGGTSLLLPRSTGDEREVMRELTKLRGVGAELNKQVEASRAATGAAQSQLRAANAVGEQPDWSMLLARLAQERGAEAVLESVELATVQVAAESGGADAKAKPGAKPPMKDVLILRLAGATRSPDEAYVFAHRLEQIGLFTQARVLETRPRDLAGEQVSAFRIECTFVDRADRESARPRQAAAAGDSR